MTLRLRGYIELPPHRSKGGFDHADIHLPTARLYVAHTANDAVDVIDIRRDHLRSDRQRTAIRVSHLLEVVTDLHHY